MSGKNTQRKVKAKIPETISVKDDLAFLKPGSSLQAQRQSIDFSREGGGLKINGKFYPCNSFSSLLL